MGGFLGGDFGIGVVGSGIGGGIWRIDSNECNGFRVLD